MSCLETYFKSYVGFLSFKKIELIPEFTKTLFNRGFPDKNPDFQVYREYKNN